MSFDYYMPSRVLFGKGKLKELHKINLPGKKALIVMSSGNSIKKYGYLESLQNELKLSDIEYVVYDKVLPNPIKEHVMEGAQIAKDNKCDFIIGIGGGSSIDSAKATAIMATNPGDYWDYVGGGTGKSNPIPNTPLPLIAITTTAGTGTECDPWMVITHNNEKIGFGNERTFPFLSIVDPELMITVPTKLTAYQGFDALFHSTEGYINSTANEMSDLYALKAITLVGEYLERVIKNGNDELAREKIALANTLSGFVESTSGCTSEHSIEHAMSAYHPELPHGAGLIMISLEYYKTIALSNSCNERMVDMAKALGKTDAKTASDFVVALEELQVKCGVDNLKLSDYNIKRDEFDAIATNARETMPGLFQVDPCEIDHKAVVNILEKSYR